MTPVDSRPETEPKERGALPDAPLAMPKQVLTATNGFSLRRLFSQRTPKTGH